MVQLLPVAISSSIDGIASALSLILATLASLQAASRLEQRICNNGAIGLMDGPPILGPRILSTRITALSGNNFQNGTNLTISDEGKGDERTFLDASPLWEHTEAFRRAAILGLVFDHSSLYNDGDDDDNTKKSSTLFSNIIRNEQLRGGSDENDIEMAAAAIEAGLLVPTASRGGGVIAKRKDYFKNDINSNNNRNPVSVISNWFVRELSAPIAAIPAWRSLLRSYLHDRKEQKSRRVGNSYRILSSLLVEWPRFLITGKSDSDRFYDPSKLDFDSSISGVVHIPCIVDRSNNTNNNKKKIQQQQQQHQSLLSSKSVRVKAFAPKTFRDLRNKCFRISEKEYARSIFNLVENRIRFDDRSELDDEELGCCHDDTTVTDMIETIVRRRGINKRYDTKTLPYISFQSNSKGAARSGTFFFFTSDGAYMIKTIKKEEAKAFVDMLPKYHRFMSKRVNSRNSLLTRFCGMYSVQFLSENDDHSPATATTIVGRNDDKWDGGLFSSTQDIATDIADDERVYVVMNSVFPPEASAFITSRFDLKGSTVGRECSIEEKQTKGSNAVLKDLDLKREVQLELEALECSKNRRKQQRQSKYGISIGARKKAALLAQLQRDVTLLNDCGVLDYSLLVGVADTTLPKRANGNSNTAPKAFQRFFQWMDAPMPFYGAGTTKVDGGNHASIRGTRMGKDVIYYMGVIDFLQPWTVKKRLERDLKGLVGYDKTAISCVAPDDYAARFLSFIESHVT
ncbi:hypothetical protein ACHAWC_009025 [Mediolabrus comicus]